jgi:hypothetical protein
MCCDQQVHVENAFSPPQQLALRRFRRTMAAAG